MKKIAFIHEKFPFGGGEVVTINVMTSLQRYGYKFILFTSELNLDKLSASLEDVEYVTLKYKIGDVRNLPLIKSKIEEEGVEIFVSPGFIVPYIDSLKSGSKCKVVYVNHNMAFWEAIFKRENGKYAASKSIFKWLEWHLLRSLKFKLGLFDKKLKNQYFNLYNSVDAFGVLCDSYGEKFAKEFDIDYKTSKFVTLTNAAYPNLCRKVSKKKEIYFVGRLFRPHKRVDRLLQIWQILFQKHLDWELIIVGEGPDNLALKAMAKDFMLERVKFIGYTSNPQDCYDRASIVCLTSTFEGWPMTLIEAQANGCVAIAFDCCAGIREILSPSWENGVLIEPFDIEAYADALSRLMSDEDLRQRIAENGFKHVSTFSEERTAKQWTDMINNLLQ